MLEVARPTPVTYAVAVARCGGCKSEDRRWPQHADHSAGWPFAVADILRRSGFVACEADVDEERTIEQRAAVAWPAEVEYPDSDGLPMAENTVQCRAIREAMGALEHHYKPGREVGMASDLMLYYREGDPATYVAPDVMVSFGVRMLGLPNYKLWEVGKPPEFVLEVSSQSSRELDRTKKVELYAGLGVREYFVFDPGDPEDVGDGQDGRLSGYRLWDSKYVESGESSERGRELESEELGLLLRPEGKLVRFRDPATGKDLPLHQEESQGRLEAERERDEQMRARQEVERKLEEERQFRSRLEAELAATARQAQQ